MCLYMIIVSDAVSAVIVPTNVVLQDDPHAHLPCIVASLFMSPGGDKVLQFLFCFSRYVLYRITHEIGWCATLVLPIVHM